MPFFANRRPPSSIQKEKPHNGLFFIPEGLEHVLFLQVLQRKPIEDGTDPCFVYVGELDLLSLVVQKPSKNEIMGFEVQSSTRTVIEEYLDIGDTIVIKFNVSVPLILL